jgi:hypothetical protein
VVGHCSIEAGDDGEQEAELPAELASPGRQGPLLGPRLVASVPDDPEPDRQVGQGDESEQAEEAGQRDRQNGSPPSRRLIGHIARIWVVRGTEGQTAISGDVVG